MMVILKDLDIFLIIYKEHSFKYLSTYSKRPELYTGRFLNSISAKWRNVMNIQRNILNFSVFAQSSKIDVC